MLFVHVSDRPRENFSQKIRHVAPLRGQACGFKDWLEGKFEEPFARDELICSKWKSAAVKFISNKNIETKDVC